MTNKTAIDALKIAREALKERRAYCEQWEYRYADEWDNEDGYIQDAIDKLAALEAEKPAEDLKALVYDIAIDCACIQKPKDYDVYERSAINKIQQYAESYHAEQCTACARQNQWMPKSVLLPVNGQTVICIHNQDKPFMGFYDYDDDEWYDVEYMIRDVTHWQPLPEAPRV